MKSIYFLKHALVVAALFSVTTVFAQTPTATTLTEIISPVVVENGIESFDFAFQSSAAWGDFNNDGYLDVIFTGVTEDWVAFTSLYKNNGDGTFTKVENPFPGLDVSSVTWLDYDNDGNLDLFLAGNIGRYDENENDRRYSGLWHNLGAAENYAFEEVLEDGFVWLHHGGGNRGSRYVAAADYNNDGWVDIAMLGAEAPNDSYTTLYRNQQGIGFVEVALPVNGEKPLIQMRSGSIEFGDVNNDGYLDLIAFGYVDNQLDYYDEFTYGGAIAVYLNNGDGSFDVPALYPGGEDGEAALGDYNNDGFLDIAVTDYSWWPDNNGGWRGDLFSNNGDGTFTLIPSSVNGFPQTQSATTAWGDLNNDGYEEVGFTHAHPTAVFYNNLGNDTFTRVNVSFDDDGVSAEHDFRGATICFVDYDNDGNLDLFVNGYDDYKKRARLLRNDLGEGIPENQAPTAPTNLQATTEDGVTTFTWNASSDVLTPSDALRYNLYVKYDDVTIMVLPADLTTGRLKVNETLAPLTTTFYQLKGLPEDGNYEWGVSAIDNAKNSSAFAPSATSIKTVVPASVKVRGDVNAIRITSDKNLNGSVNVYSVTGTRLFAQNGTIGNTTVDIPAGIYIVKVVSGTDSFVTKVIVK